MAREKQREYRRSHPWLTFGVDFGRAAPAQWALLGQAVARCEQIAAAVLPPAVADEMWRVYLSKGAGATTAIEGNTLSESQVRAQLEGKLKLPPSQQYLQREVDNVLRAYTEIAREISAGKAPRLTPQWICKCNGRVLAGLKQQLAKEVKPGALRTHSVVVGRYRGAPAKDCAHLLQKLCDWLEGEQKPLEMFESARGNRTALAILHAVIAHLYIAWIHPFGDGNGRTARLVEFVLLARAGVPLPSAQLLSNHYNQTRDQYYRQLDRAGRAKSGRGDPLAFIRYALQGFVEGLDEQCQYIAAAQFHLAWEHLLYEMFRSEGESAVAERRRELALALGQRETPVQEAEIPELNTKLARLYANKTRKTLKRDLKWLMAEKKLINSVRLESGAAGYAANRAIMRAFQSPAA